MSTYDNYENFELPARPLTPQKSKNKLLWMLVIGLLTLVVVLASLLFLNSFGNNNSEQNATSAQPAGIENPQNNTTEQTEQTDPGSAAASDNSVEQLPEVDPQIKALIEAQHRRQADDPMALGNPDAPLVIEMYADFRCGHCANFALNTEPQLIERLEKGDIRYEFNNLPILGPESEAAARAAVAAGKHNKFWEYHHELFLWAANGNGNYTEAGFIELATKVGILNLEEFKSDLNSPEIAAQVAAELSNGRDKLGLTGTPALLVGYSYIPGAVDFATLKTAIDAELSRPVE